MDQHLHVFVAVAERQNFSRAAEALHMTQPAVSQYIRTFEENIGVRLLERTNKYVRLNKAGEIVYHHAKEIVSLYTRMQNLVDDLTNKASGSLSIGASYTFGEYVLPHIIAKMQQTYPEVQPTVTIGNTAEIADAVIHHQLDVGIVEGHFKKEQQLKIEPFAEDDMVIVAAPGHPLAARNDKVAMEDLENETWVLREFGSGTREAADSVFQRHNMSPDKIMNIGSTQPIKEAVKAGLGISLLSQWAIQKELQHGDLQIVEVTGLPYRRRFSILTTSPFQTKALQVFIDLLRYNKELTAFKSDRDN
ncbi:LysR family transcriptional regulator [Lentibacillus cibarius]|uniref:LysR family transcriptional regulator n=1 Tax=Lentibacillus cibarius TaxID=2583219 RepID=A0A5S3R7Z2_9BACI|nr:LysR family transcriptional regulator [Lentibacillus cibarius]TMN23123.1 LysR family transcriptional regulator [Lentibacillus cibarius]